jgi:hypothetical protein
MSRKNAFAFISLSLLSTVLLGASLTRLTFKPGLPLPSFENGAVTPPPAEPGPPSMPMGRFAGSFALIVLAVLVIFLVIQMVRGVQWKQVLPLVWSVLWKFLLVAAVLVLVFTLLPKSEATPAPVPLPPPKPTARAPLGPVPPVLIWAAGICAGAAAVLLAARLVAGQRRRAPAPWFLEAEKAREALRDGQGVEEVILRCYRRMGQALAEEQSLQREPSMTTGEFETLLANQGVPREPVRRLTRLFDAVRYGHGHAEPAEKEDALQCLDAILEYSSRNGPAT